MRSFWDTVCILRILVLSVLFSFLSPKFGPFLADLNQSLVWLPASNHSTAEINLDGLINIKGCFLF